MFPKHSKVSRIAGPLWLATAISLALMLVLSTIFVSSVQAQGRVANPDGGIVRGKFCVEGIVIDHEEQPIGGVDVYLSDGQNTYSATSSTDDDDEGEFEFDEDTLPQAPATYTASIDLATLPGSGWEGVTSTEFDVTIDYGREDCVRIRFKVRQIVEVTVYKIDADHNPLPGWIIEAKPGPGNLFAIPQDETTDASGTVVFRLTSGKWIFTERQEKPDNMYDDRPDPFMPVVPPNGQQTLDIDPDRGPYEIVFKNEFHSNGCIVIRKEADFGLPTAGVGGWGFQLLRADGSLYRQGVTDGSGYLEFKGLPYGPYILVEEDRPGWNELTPREMDVYVRDGGCNRENPLVFFNEQDDSGFCIEGYKLDANGKYGIPGWEISAEPLMKGGYDPDNVFTDGTGKYVFKFPNNDYTVPGALYEICEDDEVDGWLPHTPTCQTVRLPEWPGACVQAKDFVNQQVGHTESQKKGGMGWDKPGGMDKGMSCKAYHVVKPGEGLFSIGSSYKVSPQSMVDANPSVRGHKDFWVYVGQKLCIP